MKEVFSGVYYKHQKGGHSVAFIAGVSLNHAFIQVITVDKSYYFKYPLSAYKIGKTFRIAENIFSANGIKIRIKTKNITIHGEIRYTNLTPIRYDIMGPFKYFPMQCCHKIISLHHNLIGNLTINGNFIDFTGGIGYIEGDSGTSFPDRYAWIQCNDFNSSEKNCITVSVADIPFMGLSFKGCICIVYYNNKEYRFATYLGVKILLCNEKQIILKQGALRLEIEINPKSGQKIIAPTKGEMTREIRECLQCGARFRFIKDGKNLFDEYSETASFEYVNTVIYH